MYYTVNVHKMIYVEVFKNGSKNADKDIIFDPLRMKAYISALLAINAKAKKEVVNFAGVDVVCYIYTLKDSTIDLFKVYFEEPMYTAATDDVLVNTLYSNKDEKLKCAIYVPINLYNKIVQEIETDIVGVFLHTVHDMLKQKDLKPTECKQDFDKMTNPSKEDLQEAHKDALEQLNTYQNAEIKLRRAYNDLSAKYDCLYRLSNKYKKLCNKLNLKGTPAKELNRLNAEFKELKSKN